MAHEVKSGLVIVGLLLGGVAAFGSFYTISEGNVGITTRFSEAVDQVGPGLHWKTPFIEGVKEFEVRERSNTEDLAAATANQLPITATVSINWTMKSEAALDMFKKYGTLDQFENRILDKKLRQAAKAAIGKFNADVLIKERHKVTEEIRTQMEGVMEPYPVTVNSPQLENIVLPPEYLTAVMAKEKAREDAAREKFILDKQNLTAQQEVQTATAKAQGIRETAAAEAEATRVKGEAEADAIRAKAAALRESSEIVELEKAKRWDGVLPHTVLGSNMSMLWSMKSTGPSSVN